MAGVRVTGISYSPRPRAGVLFSEFFHHADIDEPLEGFVRYVKGACGSGGGVIYVVLVLDGVLANPDGQQRLLDLLQTAADQLQFLILNSHLSSGKAWRNWRSD